MVVVVVVANAVVSNYASRKFQRAILGFEPEEIGRLYGELEVTMSTIKEGVLSIDAQGVLRSINRSACQILGIDRDKALNKPLTDTLRDSDLYTVLEAGQEDHDIEIFLNHKRLIANRSPIFVEGKIVGAVSSFACATRSMSLRSSSRKPKNMQTCCVLKLMSIETSSIRSVA